MRPSIALALAAILVAGLPACGQKGPLVRPTRSPTTPVVIRTPGTADAPQQQPDGEAPKR
jgi:predicted small lipoprotein YifL